MDDKIIYCPGKIVRFCLYFFLPAPVFFSLLALGALPDHVGSFCVMFLMGIMGVWIIKVTYDISQKAIVFEKDGVRIIGGSYKEYQYIPWEKISYVCYARNFKGSIYLVLSQKVLDPKEIRHIVRSADVNTRYFIEGSIIMPMDPTQDLTQVVARIKEHISISGPDYFAEGR